MVTQYIEGRTLVGLNRINRFVDNGRLAIVNISSEEIFQ